MLSDLDGHTHRSQEDVVRVPVQEPMAEQQHNARTRNIESETERARAVREGRKKNSVPPVTLILITIDY